MRLEKSKMIFFIFNFGCEEDRKSFLFNSFEWPIMDPGPFTKQHQNEKQNLKNIFIKNSCHNLYLGKVRKLLKEFAIPFFKIATINLLITL